MGLFLSYGTHHAISLTSIPGKKTCPTCRAGFPAKFVANPRINTGLAAAIRMARNGVRRPAARANPRVQDADRPAEAFRTERAVRQGLANACSGRLMVTVPADHFGPIPLDAAVDGDAGEWFPRVGAGWNDRLHCRQWGAHFPHVAGIAGQSGVGAQSVVLSGGYEDDMDEGEWFLYTGSGGRDLSGNKRVSNVQSFDQAFDKMNEALRVSCERGLPVRVVRSAKEKRSAYAPPPPEEGVVSGPPLRYDGIYMVTRAYRKPGAQGKLVCRYLFVRCDNEPAPWSSEECGDRPDARPWAGDIPAPAAAEMAAAVGVVHAGPAPTESWWGWDAGRAAWGWTRPAPESRKLGGEGTGGGDPGRLRKKAGEAERALREFKCRLCAQTLADPLTTPCGHAFCKPCLVAKFEGIGDVADRGGASRSMRARSIPKPCPTCKADCAEFMLGAQVNVAVAETIAKLTEAAATARADAAKLEAGGRGGGEGGGEEGEAAAGAAAVAGPSATPAKKAKKAKAAAATAAVAAVAPPPVAAAAVVVAAPAAAASPAPPPPQGPAAALAAEFPSIDADTIALLLADQEGDARDVRVMLARMVKGMEADARKAKAGASAAAKAGCGEAAPAAEGGSEPSRRPASGGGRPLSAGAAATMKRPRSGSK
jgi:E3 ubiquitin-protein ligase UHRF1